MTREHREMSSFERIKEKHDIRRRGVAEHINWIISSRLDKIQYYKLYECNQYGDGYLKFNLSEYDFRMDDLFWAEKSIKLDPRVKRIHIDQGSLLRTIEVYYHDPEKPLWPELSQDVVKEILKNKGSENLIPSENSTSSETLSLALTTFLPILITIVLIIGYLLY